MKIGKEHLAPWERAFDRVLTPLEEFIHRQTTSGMLLMLSAVVALVIANGPLAETYAHIRCPPWRAKRRRVVPGSREATRDTRRAEGAKGDPKGASERGVQSYGRPVCSRNELAMLWRNAG